MTELDISTPATRRASRQAKRDAAAAAPKVITLTLTYVPWTAEDNQPANGVRKNVRFRQDDPTPAKATNGKANGSTTVTLDAWGNPVKASTNGSNDTTEAKLFNSYVYIPIASLERNGIHQPPKKFRVTFEVVN